MLSGEIFGQFCRERALGDRGPPKDTTLVLHISPVRPVYDRRSSFNWNGIMMDLNTLSHDLFVHGVLRIRLVPNSVCFWKEYCKAVVYGLFSYGPCGPQVLVYVCNCAYVHPVYIKLAHGLLFLLKILLVLLNEPFKNSFSFPLHFVINFCLWYPLWILQFSSVQLLSCVWLFVTPWITAR